jgi:hypothetical protein
LRHGKPSSSLRTIGTRADDVAMLSAAQIPTDARQRHELSMTSMAAARSTALRLIGSTRLFDRQT